MCSGSALPRGLPHASKNWGPRSSQSTISGITHSGRRLRLSRVACWSGCILGPPWTVPADVDRTVLNGDRLVLVALVLIQHGPAAVVPVNGLDQRPRVHGQLRAVAEQA